VEKELPMSQSALHASSEIVLDSSDFDQNYRYLKTLIKELKAENGTSVGRAIFGEEDESRALTKKQMKQIARYLRKIEHQYDECTTPPIPDELEDAIRDRSYEEWLPWELEAIEKVDAWREELQERKRSARALLGQALESVRQGKSL
jgi:hypothetical protein